MLMCLIDLLTSPPACVLGSSVICIDLLLNRFERWKDFRIQDSGYFLAVSMSFSFGVMVRTIQL
jgi:ZIP family zinc transporter